MDPEKRRCVDDTTCRLTFAKAVNSMALFGGIELPGCPDLENVRKLDLLPLRSLYRQRRYGFAINPDYFRQLTSEFDSEMRALEKDITSFVPPEKLEEFVGKANQVEGHETEEEREKREVEEAARGIGGGDEDVEGKERSDSTINASSAEQIGKLLFDILGLDLKQGKLKRTAGGRISTGKAQLRALEQEHPVVKLILAYRERAKLKSTYTESLVKQAKFHPKGNCCPVCELPHRVSTWRVHTEITTTRAETGRFSSKNPNCQNIPQRSKLGERVRAGFIASPGTKLVSVDFSQIELRVMAHLAMCKSMIEIYWAGQDIHEMTAMKCFGLTKHEEVDKIKHRIPSKTANFLCVYGGSGKALYSQMLMAMLLLVSEGKLDAVPIWLTEQWCDQFVQDWYADRPEVLRYMEVQAYRARRYGKVWDSFGRVRPVPEVRSTHSWISAAGIRQAGNMPDQSLAAGMMKLAVAETDELLSRWLDDADIWCWPLLPVHDQLISECDENFAEELLEEKLRIFDNVMTDRQTGELRFRVPVKSDGEVMGCWKKE